MDCHYAGELLLDYIEGELSNEFSQKVEAHLRECESCSKEFARIQKMVNLMETLPSISPIPGISQKIMAKLEKEERLTSRSFLAKFKLIPKKVMLTAAAFGVLACVLYVTMTPFVHRPSFQFQTWAATVQAVSFDLEETGWWARRKKIADERLLPEDKYIGVIFGGILNQPEEINFLVKWIKPDGQPFNETAWKGRISPGLCSFMSSLAIDDYELRDEMKEVTESSFNGEVIYKKQKGRLSDFPGLWQLEIYMNNKLQTTFQIEF